MTYKPCPANSVPPRIALLACSVFEHEIALHSAGATHIAEVRSFEMGLHDQPSHMRTVLQAQIEDLERRTDIEAIALVCGLCGCGTAGLQSARLPLVIPRAHDCITLFMGSKEAYAENQRRCPGCYYYTPGWNRGRRVPGPEQLEFLRAEMAAKFEPEDVEFLVNGMREQWALHDTVIYLDLGTADAQAEADYARRCAEWLGWKFEHRRGDPALLRDLLFGRWDSERFQIIEPGSRLRHVADDTILRAEPAPNPPPASGHP